MKVRFYISDDSCDRIEVNIETKSYAVITDDMLALLNDMVNQYNLHRVDVLKPDLKENE
ncbi:MAG: hypothetical protein KAS32_19815 [Candidatus Peribacteraceae bacterium]|nr:hypothetical protein [Candidatus Peribacteraceae bacterium]